MAGVILASALSYSLSACPNGPVLASCDARRVRALTEPCVCPAQCSREEQSRQEIPRHEAAADGVHAQRKRHVRLIRDGEVARHANQLSTQLREVRQTNTDGNLREPVGDLLQIRIDALAVPVVRCGDPTPGALTGFRNAEEKTQQGASREDRTRHDSSVSEDSERLLYLRQPGAVRYCECP